MANRNEGGDSGLILRWWQVILLVGTFAVQAGEARVTLARVERDVAQVSSVAREHTDGPGHVVANERIEQLKTSQAQVAGSLIQIADRLMRIEANLIRLCAASRAQCREQ